MANTCLNCQQPVVANPGDICDPCWRELSRDAEDFRLAELHTFLLPSPV